MTDTTNQPILRSLKEKLVEAATDGWGGDAFAIGIIDAQRIVDEHEAALKTEGNRCETSAAKDKDALTDAVDWNRETWRKDYKSTDGTTNQPVQLSREEFGDKMATLMNTSAPYPGDYETAQRQLKRYIDCAYTIYTSRTPMREYGEDATQEEEIRMLRRELYALQDIYNKGWQPIETAPKDKPIILHCAYPWSVVGIWNEVNKKWVYSNLQCDQYEGHWIDTYFENEYEATNDSKGIPTVTHWMPLPAPPTDVEV